MIKCLMIGRNEGTFLGFLVVGSFMKRGLMIGRRKEGFLDIVFKLEFLSCEEMKPSFHWFW